MAERGVETGDRAVIIGEGDVKAHAMKRRLWDLSEAMVPRRHVFDFNQALMDFGATVCVARKPLCLVCPMRTICRAYPWNPEKERARRAPARARAGD